MRVLFRVDAATHIGLGHVMRCLTLAHHLTKSGSQCIFVCKEHEGHMQSHIESLGYVCILLPKPNIKIDVEPIAINTPPHLSWLGANWLEDAYQVQEIVKLEQCDCLVIDHYALDYRWEEMMRPLVGRIMVIDDLADRKHDCDILLDQNIYADMDKRYIDKVPASCQLFLGARFALLREEFLTIRPFVKERSGFIKNIIIFFGGIDANNYTFEAINAVINLVHKHLQVNVVIGALHPYRAKIEAICVENSFTCHIQTKQMAKLMNEADFAIGAGGISTYERLYLRLPAILKPVSLNQQEPLVYMSQIKLFDLYDTQQELEEKLINILAKENCSPLDCVGGDIDSLLDSIMKDIVVLKPPCAQEVRHTYQWLQNKTLREDFALQHAPKRREHIDYWRCLLADKTQSVYAILYSRRHVGNCGLKNFNDKNNSVELWIYIADISVRGKGVGRAVVDKLLSIAKNHLQANSVFLHVAKNNMAAIKLYKNTGFQQKNQLLEGRWKGQDAEFMYMEVAL